VHEFSVSLAYTVTAVVML